MSAVVAAIASPGAEEIFRILTFRAGYNTSAVIIGAIMLGVAAGAIGVFALLRGRALMGDALSHATLPGVAGGFLLGTWMGFDPRSMPVLLTGATVTGVLGVLTVLFISRHTRLREDAAIGIVLSVFFGAGVVLMQVIARLDIGNRGGLQQFIYGQTAAMQGRDAMVLALLAVLVLLVSLAFLKEFRVVCFNAEYARAQGWPVGVIDIIMMTFVVLVTVVGLQMVGLILVVAMIVIPAAAARFWTDRLFVMLLTAAVLGGFSGYAGGAASAMAGGLPAGAVIVLASGGVFLLSMFFAPARGVVAGVVRTKRVHDRTNRQHLLRMLLEADEVGDAEGLTRTGVRSRRAWPGRSLGRAIRQLRSGGAIDVDPSGGLELTTTGREQAARVTRNHRLWEEYLVRHADIAPSHVDWSADLVEHVLSSEMVRQLEESVAARGGALPPSVHPLTGDPETAQG